MTNRENPVWHMAYAVEFARQMNLRLYDPVKPDIASFRARVIADAAVEALGDQPKDSWLVEGLKHAKREADENPELRKRVADHPSGMIGDPQQVSAPQPRYESMGIAETPESPQPRDKSRDVWVFESLEYDNEKSAIPYAHYVERHSDDLPGERYVPYSQLEELLLAQATDAVEHERSANERIRLLQRDSELLDAILSAVTERGLKSDATATAIKNAIAERAKR